jgi:hypothetical protein
MASIRKSAPIASAWRGRSNRGAREEISSVLGTQQRFGDRREYGDAVKSFKGA